MCFRYLASGNTFTDMHYTYRLGISTIRNIVKSVCNALWNSLKDEALPIPTEETWKEIADRFRKYANFPFCIGAVDGKHVRVSRFPGSGSMNLNYKSFFSIVLMAVADSDYRFIYVDIGAYGKDCDSSVFMATDFYKALTDSQLHIPPPGSLQSSGSTFHVPFVLVGDEAFALSTHLMRPFGGHNLSVNRRIFNYRLCRARRFVECTFGILCNKWRIFHRALNVSKTFARDIVKACVILHNIVRARDSFTLDDLYTVQGQGLVDVERIPPPRGSKSANDVREHFVDYFVSPEGSLPWQLNKI